MGSASGLMTVINESLKSLSTVEPLVKILLNREEVIL